MNQFLEWSIDYASEKAYLDDLFKIYPTYDMNLKNVYEKCSQPKETNMQIGPMFKNWIRKGTLGFDVLCLDDFTSSNEDAILDASDKEMEDFARNNLGYKHEKGLDFLARISGKYIIGETKFLSDFDGHHNAQFNDAISTISAKVNRGVIKIAILDGVLYIKGNNKMYREITTSLKDCNIMSALLLRTFLYTV